MKPLSIGIVIALSCLYAPETRAGGLVQKLPNDGTWARYHVQIKMENPKNMVYSGTMTIRSVGRENVNSQPCRWIEIESHTEINNQKMNSLGKILVPEKLFEKGNKLENISEKIIRGWEKTNDLDPRQLKDLKSSRIGLATFFQPNPAGKDSRINEKKIVEYQKGRLEIETGITGTLNVPAPENANIKIDTSGVYSIWAHDKVPYGTAIFKSEFTSKRNAEIISKVSFKLEIEDHGTGAKSALPDNN